MHHMDAEKVNGEKVRQKLHKNVTSYIEQDLEVKSPKAAAVRPPISHL